MLTSAIAYGSAQTSLAKMVAKQAFAQEPKFGLGFRFTVHVAGLSLGDWQSCSGLKVEYKATELKRGGDHLGQEWLPERVSYPRVVLKRAIERDSSAKVQAWLKDAAQGWLADEKTNATGTATVMLYDAHAEPVLKWVLSEVRPAAWSGPDLDASASKLAIETLELVHGGFEVLAPRAPASTTPPGGAKEELTLEHPEEKSVIFKAPPERIGIIRNAEKSEAKTAVVVADGASGESGKPGVTQYKLDKLVLAGPWTAEDVSRLLDWATTTRKPPSGGEAELAHLKVKWGLAFPTDAFQVSNVTVNFTRFKANGTPIRAEVGLTLNMVVPKTERGSGNPTSGGLPGRSSHVVTATDSLAMLARRHYGVEGGWRDIADANSLDDPLRLRPGQLLYLPALSELDEGMDRDVSKSLSLSPPSSSSSSRSSSARSCSSAAGRSMPRPRNYWCGSSSTSTSGCRTASS